MGSAGSNCAASTRMLHALLPFSVSFVRHHVCKYLLQLSSGLKHFKMVVTVYETQTPDGWSGLGELTTLERATITQAVQQTVTATEDQATAQSTASLRTITLGTASGTTATTQPSTSATPSSFITSLSSSESSQSTPASTTTPSSTAQISTGSIVGIAIGSIAAIVLLVTCLLFAFGFRIRRAKRRDLIEITEPNEEQRPSIGTSGDDGGKAELEERVTRGGSRGCTTGRSRSWMGASHARLGGGLSLSDP